QAREALERVKDRHELHQKKAAYAGKKGELQKMMRHMRDLTPEQRPAFGQVVNRARDRIQALVDANLERVENEAIEQRIQQPHADATLPARAQRAGGPHPL